MNDANKWPYTTGQSKSTAIKIKHLLGLKKGKPVRLSTESGELIVELEGISLLTARALVTIVAAGQVKPTVILGGSFAVQAMADRLRQRLYRASPN